MVLDTVARRIRRDGANPTLKRDSWWPSSSAPWSSNGKVNDAAALSQTAFWSGLYKIQGAISSMPIHVYQDEVDAGGKVVKKSQIQTRETAYIWTDPNEEMSRIDLWSRVVADIVRGNGYLWVDKDGNGGITGIWWLARRRVRPGRTSSGQKVYEVDGELPMIDYKQGGEIIHFPNWGDGIAGYDPVQVAMKAFALGLAAEEYANEFFAGGGVPSGVISTDQNLTQEQADGVLANWVRRIKSNRPAVFGSGAKYQAISLDHEKSQMHQLRGFQVQEISRLLNIPPALLADVDHASQGGGNGVEEMNRTFYIYALQPIITRIEQKVSSDLLVRELTGRYIKLNPNNFLRGDTLRRYQSFRLATFMTENEKREFEDMEPIDGGDQLLVMTNMTPIDKLGEQAMAAGGGPAGR